MKDERGLRIRPGRPRAGGQLTITQVLRGTNGLQRLAKRNARPSTFGRGRAAAVLASARAAGRRVTVKARVARHRAGSAPLGAHLAYLQRDGVSRDGSPGELFDNKREGVDGRDFADRCKLDRHHFRFIVSPEDSAEIDDLRPFTRDLMADMAHDLGTTLDWVAVEHRNTAHPHVHVLVRGRADDGQNLVIARDYIREGMRLRAERLVTLELGPRSDREVRRALDVQVGADRWTGLDRGLARLAEANDRVVDLRPQAGTPATQLGTARLGRMRKLEEFGLATNVSPAQWRLGDRAEATLRELGERGDIIKRMHRAAADRGVADFVIAGEQQANAVVGRLIERGLDDELRGTAYAIVDAVDGRVHHLRLPDLDATSDAPTGAIVEVVRPSSAETTSVRLSVQSDLSLTEQVTAPGATWLDRKLLDRDRGFAETGFGRDATDALSARVEHLAGEGLARRQNQRWVFARDLLDTLAARELAAVRTQLAIETGLPSQPTAEGEHISGTYRRRMTLASGRFAMLDDGNGFALVPWTPALEKHLGQHVSGVMRERGVDWSFERARGLGL